MLREKGVHVGPRLRDWKEGLVFEAGLCGNRRGCKGEEGLMLEGGERVNIETARGVGRGRRRLMLDRRDLKGELVNVG